MVGRLRSALVPAILVAVIGAGIALAHSAARDRAAETYQRYVREYVDGWSSSADPGGPRRDEQWVLAHPDLVLAEGERACAWLVQRPDAAEVDPTGRSTVDALSRRFAGSEYARNPRVSVFGHSAMTVGAWAHLCSSVRADKTAPRSRDQD